MADFVEVKTQDLVGDALDWAVAGVVDVAYVPNYLSVSGHLEGSGEWKHKTISNFRPSTDWAHGGPLIQRYHMDFCCEHPETIGAALCDENGLYIDDRMVFGKTHLMAACRALIAHRLGDTVSVPKELLP